MIVQHILVRPVEASSFGQIAAVRRGPSETLIADLNSDVWADGLVVEVPLDEDADPRRKYVPDMAEPAVLADRPEVSVTIPPLAVGGALTLTGLSEGTIWEVWDLTDSTLPPALSAEGEVGPDGALTEPMEDAGTYELRLSPPFPWLGATHAFEVSDGA